MTRTTPMSRAFPEPEAPMLAVTGLDVTFAGGEHAVRGMSFEVAAGETLALIGESGAGKTATALAVVGLLPATATVAGSIRLRGRELLGLAEKDLAPIRGADIAVIFQDSAFTPVRRVGTQIAEAVRAHMPMSRRMAAARAVELLADTGAPDAARVARAFPHQLSGGQLRRAMIATSVAADPAVILADEPTAALDALTRAQVLATLQAAQRRTGAALVLITHDLTAAQGWADRVLVMRAGRPVELGTADDVFHRPRAPYTIDLLSAVSHLDDRTAPDDRASTDHHATRDPRSPLLEVENLVTRHPPGETGFPRRRRSTVHAVDGIGFDVRAGETLGLAGESGCGKTTTLLEILRLGMPQGGRISVFGRDTATLSASERRAFRRHLGFVFQDPWAALDPRMTVEDSLAEPLRAHGRYDGGRVPELLQLVGLAPAHAHRRPGELSGGQLQRVGIARALALEPKLVLLDEPFSALDATTQVGIIALLHELRARLSLSYVIAAHDLAALRRLADRVAIMRRGRVVEIGDSDAIHRKPAHPYTRMLFAAVPSPDPDHLRAQERVDPHDDPTPYEDRPGCRFRTRCPVRATLAAPDRRRCAEEEPAVRNVASGHAVACHFPWTPQGVPR